LNDDLIVRHLGHLGITKVHEKSILKEHPDRKDKEARIVVWATPNDSPKP